MDLDIPDHYVIAAIIRRGNIVVPQGDITFEAMDEVLAVVGREAEEHMASLFHPGNAHTNSTQEGVL